MKILELVKTMYRSPQNKSAWWLAIELTIGIMVIAAVFILILLMK